MVRWATGRSVVATVVGFAAIVVLAIVRLMVAGLLVVVVVFGLALVVLVFVVGHGGFGDLYDLGVLLGLRGLRGCRLLDLRGFSGFGLIGVIVRLELVVDIRRLGGVLVGFDALIGVDVRDVVILDGGGWIGGGD